MLRTKLWANGFLAILIGILLGACDDPKSNNSPKSVQAQAAVEQGFNALSSDPSVRTALVFATVPSRAFRALASQAPGIAGNDAANTLLRAASISKMFTAVLVLQLAEEGRLQIDQPITQTLGDTDMPPGYRLAQLHNRSGQEIGGQITVRQLLNHTSGLADIFFDEATAATQPLSLAQRYILNMVGALSEGLETRQWQGGRELLGYYFQQRYHEIPFSLPGERYHYADTNYFLLGLMIERLTGQRLADVYRQRIFTPLGLYNASLEWYEPRRGEPMHHFIKVEVDPAQLPAPLRPELANADIVALGFNTSFDWAGGGLLLSANDLDQFLRALFAGKLFQHNQTLALMRESVSVGVSGNRYGLGLAQRDVEGVTCYGHEGAWGIQAWHCPPRDLTLVSATNQFAIDPESATTQLLGKLVAIYR
jgi:D-alanyl-D-alanine carboxypeptidase